MTDVVGTGATEKTRILETDILIVGSGMGGSTLAWALRDSGQQVLVAERGSYLPREHANSDLAQVYLRGRYKNAETWYDGITGKPFKPGNYYYVGGNTRVYGACLPRFRVSDFKATRLADGISPAWPFSYDDLEPHYDTVERLFRVRGHVGEDPTEPPHSGDYELPPLAHEPTIEEFAQSLKRQGLHPFHMAGGMDLQSEADRAACTSCDGAPCETGHKSDAENCALRIALESPNVTLLTKLRIDHLETSLDGDRVTAAIGQSDDGPVRIIAKKYVLAAGAVNSAVVMLRSASERHPRGLSNSSGLLGRNYMVHNSTFFMAINPFRKNLTLWQKTLGLNDWYESGPNLGYPLGNVQMLGKLRKEMLKAAKPWVPNFILKWMTDHSVDIYLTTEDLATKDNGVRLVDGGIHVWWKRNNERPHQEFVRRMKKVVRKAGYPIVVTQRMDIDTNSHQCGTAVAGTDPKISVLNADCRAHELDNLWVVDSAFFPSSAALNPALTIAANAVRVAPKILAS